MKVSEHAFNEQNSEDSRPATARSVIEGSITSLRSLFHKKKIYPIEADVVYGTGDPSEDNTLKRSKRSAIEENAALDDDVERKRNYCFSLFSRLKDAWIAEHNINAKKDPDMYMKTTLKQLFIYILYLLVLMIVTFGQASTNLYTFTTAMTDNIVKYKFADGSGSFASIGGVADFWKYVESPLMQTLFWNTWYNLNRNGNRTLRNLIYYDDKLVGVPQLRLLRTKPNTCTIPTIFKSLIYGCYDTYTVQNADTTPFGPKNDTAWIYSSNGSTYSHSGYLTTYDSNGYMQPLTRDQATSLSIIANLKNNLWLNHSARAVFIDFTFYNSNVDLFSVVKLVFEFPSSGGAIANSHVRSLKLLRYVSSFDYFILFTEVIFLIYVIYYVLEEMIEIRKYRLKYFVQLWNLIDIFVVMISFGIIVMDIYKYMLANSKLNYLLTIGNTYVDFDFAAYWQKIYNEALCINIFLAWIKIFKYISFNKTTTQLTETLRSSMKDMTGFAVMFFIVFMGYSQFAYLAFSSQIIDYRNFEESGFSLFRLILGEFNFYAFYNADTIIGPLFFVSFIFFVFFVLLTMIIAIINDQYVEVKGKIDEIKETYHVAQYLKKQILSRLQRDKVTKIQEVLQKGDFLNVEELSFETWRKELLKYGYADVEIQALFMKYDEDGDRMLDYDERNRMLQDITERKTDLLGTEENEDDKDSEPKEDDFVSTEQIHELADRINIVETGLFDIVSKIDRVLEFLANSEQAKLNHQKNIRYSLAILQSSKTDLVT